MYGLRPPGRIARIVGGKPRQVPKTAIAAWKKRIGPPAPLIRVTVINGRGKTLGDFEFLPELEDIKKKIGAGTFKLVVWQRNARGSLVYAASKRVIVK